MKYGAPEMWRKVPIVAFVACVCACGSGPPGWHERAALPAARFEAAAVALNGRIYYVGGITGINGQMATAVPVSRVDVLDPATGSWSSAPDLPVDAPKHHLAVAVLGGRLYVLGGFDGIIGRGLPTDAFRPVATTWVLEGASWRRLADQPIARGGATAQAIDGVIYVTGGSATEGVPPYADTYAYDPARDAWSARASMPTAREHVTSCLLDGTMIVLGGWVGAARTAMNSAERYDPRADRWTVLAPMPTARGGLGAAVVGTQCYAVGGEDWALPLPGTFATLEAFSLADATWRTLAPMALARHGIGVAAHAGKVFVLGGGPQQGNSYTDRVEAYTPE